MLRKHKTYLRPKRPFDKDRIVEEAGIKKKFGLKNKKEIWKSEAKVKSMREKAKKLIGANEANQEKLFDQLKKMGLNVNSIPDALSLVKEDFLKRRLQSVLVKKNLATTQKSARQLITHKKVLVNGKVVDSPSYIVPVSLENKISLKHRKIKKKDKEVEYIKIEEQNVESKGEEKQENEKEE